MQMSRFTFGKPSKAVCAADEKAIRRPAASFVRRRLRQKQQKRRQPGLMRIAARDMKFCCSLMKCAKKRGVARAGCRYNKGRPYICFRPTRLVGGVESPPAHRGSPATLQSTHGGGAYAQPNHATRNQRLGMAEPWTRLRSRGRARCAEALRRILRRGRPGAQEKPESGHKPYEQMNRPASASKSTRRSFREAALPIRCGSCASPPQSMRMPAAVFRALIGSRAPAHPLLFLAGLRQLFPQGRIS